MTATYGMAHSAADEFGTEVRDGLEARVDIAPHAIAHINMDSGGSTAFVCYDIDGKRLFACSSYSLETNDLMREIAAVRSNRLVGMNAAFIGTLDAQPGYEEALRRDMIRRGLSVSIQNAAINAFKRVSRDDVWRAFGNGNGRGLIKLDF